MTFHAVLSKESTRPTERLGIPHYMFILYWMLKPFYAGPSGYMQPADYLFVLTFLMWVVHRRGSVRIESVDFRLGIFAACATVINGVYYLIYKDTVLLYSIAYYLYCFMVVLVVRDFMQSRRFLRLLMWASTFNLVLQLVVLVLGLGTYLWKGFRFMGTFNDPNQYAFSMFSSFLIIFIISSYLKEIEGSRKKALVLLSFLLAAYFIVQGGSTGMLLGIGVFSVLFLLTFIYSERTPAFRFLQVLLVVLLALFLPLALSKGLSPQSLEADAGSSTFLLYRLFEKVGKVESGGIMSLFQDRGLNKLFEHPIYLLFGSGEGAHGRFPGKYLEVHSTFPGILYYYGIIPFAILCSWVFRNLRKSSRILLPAFLAFFIESLTLAHQRQPAFWIIIMLGSLEYANPRELRKYRLMVEL